MEAFDPKTCDNDYWRLTRCLDSNPDALTELLSICKEEIATYDIKTIKKRRNVNDDDDGHHHESLAFDVIRKCVFKSPMFQDILAKHFSDRPVVNGAIDLDSDFYNCIFEQIWDELNDAFWLHWKHLFAIRFGRIKK